MTAMLKIHDAILIVILQILTPKSSNAAGENEREFKTICALYNLLTQPVPQPYTLDQQGKLSSTIDLETTAKMETIKMLNLSAAPTVMTSILSDAGDKGKWAAVSSNESQKFYFKDEQQLEDLKAVYKKLAGDDGKGFRAALNLLLKSEAASAVRPQIYKLTADAIKFSDEVSKANTEIKRLRKAAQTNFISALYGQAYATAKDAIITGEGAWTATPPEAEFPWTDTQSQDATCAKATGKQGASGAALATDAVCICTAHGSGATTFCGDGVSINEDLTTGSGNRQKATGVWNKLRGHCSPPAPQDKLTLATTTLRLYLTKFHTQLGGNAHYQASRGNANTNTAKRTAYYGAFAESANSPATCTASTTTPLNSANKGFCISYEDFVLKGLPIPWEAKILAAAEKIDSQQAIYDQALKDIAAIESLQRQMESLLVMAPLLDNGSTPTTPVTGGSSAEKKPAKCKLKNTITQECPITDCEYDDKKKECKPKAGTDTTAEKGAGDEDAGGATTVNVRLAAGAKDECDCIEEKCKDSSILVNKKLVLMASALVSFVAF
uniref:Variant surface glycoprotein 1125.4025 n=1 Tax=Trypanosoma brucei TaxID=5691 RepID=A0A1J0R9Q0_9TRYP|nr:variant surface glycoprotein 1125.4025 [Trypanosoma brucei]